MGQTHSYCTDGKESNKANAFIAVEEVEEMDTEAIFTFVENISKAANTTNDEALVNTITPCSSTMNTKESNHVNIWETSLKQTIISDEAANTTTKVMFVDTIPPCSTTDTEDEATTEGDNTKEATEDGIVSDMEFLKQTVSVKMAMASTPKKKSNKVVNKNKKTYKATTTPGTTSKAPGKTPKKSTRTKKHKTPKKKEKTYAQVAIAAS
jgi:hypothetical protein